MITLSILLFVVGQLIVCSLLMAWMNSHLPIHVFHVFRRLGFRKEDTALWKELPEFASTHDDWAMWMALKLPRGWWSKLISELLTCPVCISFHISFWTAVGLSLVTFLLTWDPVIFLLIPVGAGAWPFIANKLKD